MPDGSGQGSVRDARGRFVPGQSGNPAGKIPGTRNRATLLKAELDSEEGAAMARVVIDKALAGDAVTARFCLDRLEPRPRGRAIAIDLPEGARASDVVAAFDAVLQAIAAGEITPDEAVQVTQVLEGRRRAIEMAWRERMAVRDDGVSGDNDEVEPSPVYGRGQGEGSRLASGGAGKVSPVSPHPNPLPHAGEGIGRTGALITNLLHSTCISSHAPALSGIVRPSAAWRENPTPPWARRRDENDGPAVSAFDRAAR